jgi:ectoine hydroxylase
MLLTADQLKQYWTDGFLELPELFSQAELDVLKAEVSSLMQQDSPGRVFEKDGHTLRALHGCHLASAQCNRLTRLARLVEPAMQLVEESVYVYQFKVNFKAAFVGDVWRWHQDYIYWHNEDGMPAPSATNAMVFLDEVNEFNGPLMFVRGSHRAGLIEVAAASKTAAGQAGWVQNVSADLKYALDASAVAALVAEGQLAAPKGSAGTTVLFHPNIAHASAPNLSPFSRAVVIVTYNSVANQPLNRAQPRPEFLVSRDVAPIAPLTADALL